VKANNYALKDQIMAVDGAVGPAIDKVFALCHKETAILTTLWDNMTERQIVQ